MKKIFIGIGILIGIVGITIVIRKCFSTSEDSQGRISQLEDNKKSKHQQVSVKNVGILLPLSGEKLERGQKMLEVYINEITAFNAIHSGLEIRFSVEDSLMITANGECDGEVVAEKYQTLAQKFDTVFMPSCKVELSTGEINVSETRVAMIKSMLYELFHLPILNEVYPECDTPDIIFGDYTIQACNVGAIIAGTGNDSYGKKYRFTEIQTLCPIGYHVPTGEEWSKLLTQWHKDTPSHGGEFGTNGKTSWILDWSTEDMETFQNALKLPKWNNNYPTLGAKYLSSSKSPDFPRGVYALHFNTNKVEIENYYAEGYEMIVRCFKDKD